MSEREVKKKKQLDIDVIKRLLRLTVFSKKTFKDKLVLVRVGGDDYFPTEEDLDGINLGLKEIFKDNPLLFSGSDFLVMSHDVKLKVINTKNMKSKMTVFMLGNKGSEITEEQFTTEVERICKSFDEIKIPRSRYSVTRYPINTIYEEDDA